MALSASLMTQWSVLCMVRGLCASCCGFFGARGLGNCRKRTVSYFELFRHAARGVVINRGSTKLSLCYMEIITSGLNAKVKIRNFFGMIGKIKFVCILGFLHSLGLVSLVDYGGKGRDQNTREDRNNGDDNDELYDRKALFVEFFHC